MDSIVIEYKLIIIYAPFITSTQRFTLNISLWTHHFIIDFMKVNLDDSFDYGFTLECDECKTWNETKSNTHMTDLFFIFSH